MTFESRFEIFFAPPHGLFPLQAIDNGLHGCIPRLASAATSTGVAEAQPRNCLCIVGSAEVRNPTQCFNETVNVSDNGFKRRLRKLSVNPTSKLPRRSAKRHAPTFSRLGSSDQRL